MGKAEPSHRASTPYVFRCMTSSKKAGQENLGDEDSCGCGTFQPLFNARGVNGQPADIREQEIQIEQARCKAMQNGLDSGRKEACRVARSGLSPSLKAFVNTLNELSLSNRLMVEQVSAKVIELAISICERVLGEGPRLTDAAMNDLKAALGDALCQLNRISLHFNPSDVEAIQILMAAEGMEWLRDPLMAIENDPLVPAGEFRIAEQAAARESIDRCVLSVLADFLSKPPILSTDSLPHQ